MALVIVEDGAGYAAFAVAADRLPLRVEHRPIMLDEAFQHFPGEVQPVEMRIAALEARHDAQGLGVVVEPAIIAHAIVERILTSMAEGGVAEIMGESERLGEILVEPERARQRAGDLRDLDRVGEARTEMVALMIEEHLRLMGEAAEGSRVDDAVAVALEL